MEAVKDEYRPGNTGAATGPTADGDAVGVAHGDAEARRAIGKYLAGEIGRFDLAWQLLGAPERHSLTLGDAVYRLAEARRELIARLLQDGELFQAVAGLDLSGDRVKLGL